MIITKVILLLSLTDKTIMRKESISTQTKKRHHERHKDAHLARRMYVLHTLPTQKKLSETSSKIGDMALFLRGVRSLSNIK